MDKTYSPAAKVYLFSGQLPGLTGTFNLFKTPTGQMVDSYKLFRLLMIITLNNLQKERKITSREEFKKNLFGKIKFIYYKASPNSSSIGFSNLVLENLKEEKDLPKLIQDLVGGLVDVPSVNLIGKIEEEFDDPMLVEDVEVRKLLIKVKEKAWNTQKLYPLMGEVKTDVEKMFNEAQILPNYIDLCRMISLGITRSTTPHEYDDD